MGSSGEKGESENEGVRAVCKNAAVSPTGRWMLGEESSRLSRVECNSRYVRNKGNMEKQRVRRQRNATPRHATVAVGSPSVRVRLSVARSSFASPRITAHPLQSSLAPAAALCWPPALFDWLGCPTHTHSELRRRVGGRDGSEL